MEGDGSSQNQDIAINPKQDIYGSRPGHQNFHKDPIHVGSIASLPGVTTITMAGDEDHARQRRALSHAFSTKALLEQEAIITGYIDVFSNIMKEFAETSQLVNVSVRTKIVDKKLMGTGD